MGADRFSEIMAVILKWEGGYVDDPDDNGGATNMGITRAELAKWRGLQDVKKDDVKKLTLKEATEIYRDRYWQRIRGASLPVPIDLIVMDGAVNHGVPAMARFLQEAVGAEADGTIGQQTIDAIVQYTQSSDTTIALAGALADKRKERYTNHEDAARFLAGWRNRLNDVMAHAMVASGGSWTFKDGLRATKSQPTSPPPISSIVRPIIEDADLQAALAAAGAYGGDIDGLFGPKSLAALDIVLQRREASLSGDWRTWDIARRKIALGQLICHDLGINAGRVDGEFGPTTERAFTDFARRKAGLPADTWRDEIEKLPAKGTVPKKTTWPLESDVPAYFGSLGTDCVLVSHKRLHLPYRMKIAWDLGKSIDGFLIHELVHDSAARVFDKVYAHYGDAGIEDLGLDLYGGCHNCRKKTGGSSWSMHAWSIAIDFDPGRNKYDWNHTRARLAKPDAVKFWEFWEAEGWLSLGRAKDFDWMHIQAARLP